MKKSSRRRCGFGLEALEVRNLLTAVPFGATSQDTAEYLLGDVAVNVVFLESNGTIDEDNEDWTPELAAGVKANIEEGLQWWTDTLAMYSDVHYLNFTIDYTYADDPFETGYEPISRGSQDFTLWIEEFFRDADIPASSGFSPEIRNFNHQQRVAHDANWSFTIFVVNSDNDPNGRFGDENANGTVFQRAFAFPGGQFIVIPHDRPAATVAHEVGHMFWAFDEYSSGDSYNSRRGYYGTQNANGLNGNPDTTTHEASIMSSTGSPFTNHEISRSARETLGWRDSDGDGIFDVLDVPHELSGSTTFDQATRTVQFVGDSSVQTLNNNNTGGTRNDITLNRITDLQYRVDDGLWFDLVSYDDYTIAVDATTPEVPSGTGVVAFRTIDKHTGVTSNTVHAAVSDSEPPVLQNSDDPLDVNADGHISAIDVLQIIIAINEGNVMPTSDGPPYLDVSGDSMVTSRDVLLVINYINTHPTQPVAITSDDVNDEVSSKTTSSSEPAYSPQEALSDSNRTAAAVLALFSGTPGANGEADFWNHDDDNDKLSVRFGHHWQIAQCEATYGTPPS